MLIQIDRPNSRHSLPCPEPSSEAPASYSVYIETFGCQMNEYDTEIVRTLLKHHGFRMVECSEEADAVLLNTCAIRENAHNRVYGHLAMYKPLKEQRGLVVGVLGCMAQNLKQELMTAQPIIDVLVGPDAYRRLPGLLIQALQTNQRGMAVDLSEYETYDQIMPERRDGVNAWVAVMRGCDNFCTFCVVPYTRGRERSRDPRSVLEEVHQLVEQGYRQVTLLGQNVNSYRFADWDFARLLAAVADVPGLVRVRFTSPHPKDFPPALLDVLAGHPTVCKQIHLPVQSGNDRILQLMGRSYTRASYMTLVEAIRRRGPIALSTDIICGFCSEGDEEYADTYRLVQDVEFQNAFIFKYSQRRHTIAARKYLDDVPESVKTERVARLLELQKAISLKKNRALIGSTVEVLVEGEAKKSHDQWMGHTESNTTVVWAKDDGSVSPGDLVTVAIDDASHSTLFGHLHRRNV
ncbi:MAG: tRNA (N6-isopentenyl adenosine(37)-C2)-methylthiotransferase MiaB [Nitrospirae bacterium]|nr:MAG: tRNA (N6-isopentenyl adenosine(37)-C2)-methylthiotransferase MiaB [Nitrospirota bacterium]